MNIRDPGRRRFLGTAATFAVLPLLPGLAAAAPAAPATLPKLTLANAVAKGLAYTENAASAKHAMYKPGSTCANCAQTSGLGNSGASTAGSNLRTHRRPFLFVSCK